jgi:hypothetical protein
LNVVAAFRQTGLIIQTTIELSKIQHDAWVLINSTTDALYGKGTTRLVELR